MSDGTEIQGKTFLLVGSSKSLLKTKYQHREDIALDYTCRFGYRWMKNSNALTPHMGGFNAIIACHYRHGDVVRDYKQFSMSEHTNTLFLVCPSAKERYKIRKDPIFTYQELTKEDYCELPKLFQRYGFTKYVPRTGLVTIMWLVFMRGCTVYIRGFDLDAQDARHDQDVAQTNHRIHCRHSAKAESELLKKLLAENRIQLYDSCIK